VTIGKPLAEVFAFLRDFSNFPLFMKNLKAVEKLSTTRSRWSFEHDAKLVTWDAVIDAEEPNRLIAWKTTGEAPAPHFGVLTLEPAVGDRGTVVSLKTDGDKQPGKLLGLASSFVGKDSKSQSTVNLYRLKAYLETGEFPTIEGQANGRNS